MVRLESERQNMKKSRKSILLILEHLFVFYLKKISISPHSKTWFSTWWSNPCWQAEQPYLSGSWSPNFYRSQDGVLVPLIFTDPLQILKACRLSLATQIFSSKRLMFENWFGDSITLMCFFSIHSFVALAICFGSLSCWNTNPQSIFSPGWDKVFTQDFSLIGHINLSLDLG